MADPFLEAKTDWTADDYYNYTALNRVESMILALEPKVTQLTEAVFTLSPSTTNRTVQRIEFASDLYRIENNTLTLATLLDMPAGLETPKLDWTYNSPFSFQDANRLEKNLLVLNNYLASRLNAYYFCGQYITGEEGVY